MVKREMRRLILLLILVFVAAAGMAADGDILPPDQAFRLSLQEAGDGRTVLSWQIADGYYLYRDKYRFSSKTPGVVIGAAQIPAGKKKHDDYFGEVEIHRGDIRVELPLTSENPAQEVLLDVAYQGCADIGICYPPEKKTLVVEASARKPAGGFAAAAVDAVSPVQSWIRNRDPLQQDLLPAREAFRFSAEVKDASTLTVSWQIADGYYLYREKFAFLLSAAEGTRLAPYSLPHGTPAHDLEFGDVEIFRRSLTLDLKLLRTGTSAQMITLVADFQGCADRGVCYPPMQETVQLELPEFSGADLSAVDRVETAVSEQDRIAAAISSDSLLLSALTFFGFGLLLAFTPCVFPMIPILSGIIVGHGESITAPRAFLLSLSYVLASAVTYTVFGVLAGLFGASLNLQLVFQTPWVIVSFSLLFVLLALSMFGFYTLQMPEAIQSRLAGISGKTSRGTFMAAAVMGALSTLIVGPCVAAPLAGALIYIGQTGDALLGGVVLFAMGMGMGFPLLLLGASAGKLLPRVGDWMNATKAVFGVVLLAVAAWLLQRILPPQISMLLWAALLIVPAIYMRALDALPDTASGWHRLWKGCGIIMMTAGVILIIGVASGSRDPLQPLSGIRVGQAESGPVSLPFKPVRSNFEVDDYLRVAGDTGQWVMLDYYADWCVSCKEMDRFTFSDPRVREQLDRVILLQADVTDDTAENRNLLARYDLVGPPATLFFGPDGRERVEARVIGYQNADTFLSHLKGVLR